MALSASEKKNLQMYLHARDQLGAAGRAIRIGQWYSWNYIFQSDDSKIMKFWDWSPLALVLNIDKKPKSGMPYIIAANIHHAPVKSREILLRRMLIKGTPSSVDEMKILQRTAMASIRRYNFIGIRKPRLISLDDVIYLSQFSADTYIGSYQSAIAEFKRRVRAMQ